MSSIVPGVSARLKPYFADYAAYHRTPGNEYCHYFGISAIVVSLLGLLAAIGGDANWPLGSAYARLDGATALLLAAWVWYFVLDWRIASPFVFVSTGLYFLGRAIPGPALWTLFVLGWIAQYIGHYVYEKRSPAFYRNFLHLLIGPLWVFARVSRMA